jgi:hypothetical protein
MLLIGVPWGSALVCCFPIRTGPAYLAQPDDDVGLKSSLIEAANRMSRSLDATSGVSLIKTLVAIVQRIVVHQDSIEIQVLRSAILRHLLDQEP